jgi:hypothetical protein
MMATCWSGATLPLPLPTPHGVTVAAATVRRWLHPLDWVWKHAQRIAKDNTPCWARQK